MESARTMSEGPESRVPLLIPCRAPCGGGRLHFEQIIKTKKRWGKSDFFKYIPLTVIPNTSLGAKRTYSVKNSPVKLKY